MEKRLKSYLEESAKAQYENSEMGTMEEAMESMLDCILFEDHYNYNEERDFTKEELNFFRALKTK